MTGIREVSCDKPDMTSSALTGDRPRPSDVTCIAMVFTPSIHQHQVAVVYQLVVTDVVDSVGTVSTCKQQPQMTTGTAGRHGELSD